MDDPRFGRDAIQYAGLSAHVPWGLVGPASNFGARLAPRSHSTILAQQVKMCQAAPRTPDHEDPAGARSDVPACRWLALRGAACEVPPMVGASHFVTPRAPSRIRPCGCTHLVARSTKHLQTWPSSLASTAGPNTDPQSGSDQYWHPVQAAYQSSRRDSGQIP
jgi:hypothetical protein